MENNNSSDSWVNIEGNEISRSNELNEEKIKLEIKKRLKALKNDKKLVENNTSETIENMLAYLNELQKTEGVYVEQVIRPTGLLDPIIEVRPSANQIDDLIEEIQLRVF